MQRSRREVLGLLGCAGLICLVVACVKKDAQPDDFVGGWAVDGADTAFAIVSASETGLVWEDPWGIHPAEIRDGALHIGDGNRSAVLEALSGKLLVTGTDGDKTLYGSVPAESLRERMDRAHVMAVGHVLRNTGTAMFSWVTDQVGRTRGTGDPLRQMTAAELTGLLVPEYAKEVPENDLWGHPYEYYLASDVSGSPLMRIVSGGPDGLSETEADNIEWEDGSFTRGDGLVQEEP